MIIATLEELKITAEAASVEYKQSVEDGGKPLADVRAALAQAETDMQAALESGDIAAYTTAKQKVEFEKATLTKLESAPRDPRPLYTDEQYAEYRRQLVLACNTELKPLYEQLQALLTSGIGIVKQIKAKVSTNNAVVDSFNATIPAGDVWRKTNLIAGASSRGVSSIIRDVFHSDGALQRSLDVAIKTCDRLINDNAD